MSDVTTTVETCEWCEAQLPPRTSRHRAAVRYCNGACRIKAYYAANPDKAEEIRAKNRDRARAARADRGPITHAKTCAKCGAEFAARRSDTLYCTPLCQRRAFADSLKTDGRYERLMAYKREKTGAHLRTCVDCGRPLPRGRREDPRCRECWAKPKLPDLGARLRARAEKRAADAATGVDRSTIRRFVEGRCAWCRERFCGYSYSDTLPRFCSPKCKRRVDIRGKKDRKISKTNRLAVFERDNWICHICNTPVNRAVKAPMPDAPVIDHVVALAVGGAHAFGNWKTAHFICNAHKRDLPLEEVVLPPLTA
jgi:5-methylcytosine-specific restriction endonuclease McrA